MSNLHNWHNWHISAKNQYFGKFKNVLVSFAKVQFRSIYNITMKTSCPFSLFRLCLQSRDLISYISCLPTPHAPAVGPIQANYWNLNPHWEAEVSALFTGQHVQPTNHLPTITTNVTNYLLYQTMFGIHTWYNIMWPPWGFLWLIQCHSYTFILPALGTSILLQCSIISILWTCSSYSHTSYYLFY